MPLLAETRARYLSTTTKKISHFLQSAITAIVPSRLALKIRLTLRRSTPRTTRATLRQVGTFQELLLAQAANAAVLAEATPCKIALRELTWSIWRARTSETG